MPALGSWKSELRARAWDATRDTLMAVRRRRPVGSASRDRAALAFPLPMPGCGILLGILSKHLCAPAAQVTFCHLQHYSHGLVKEGISFSLGRVS